MSKPGGTLAVLIGAIVGVSAAFARRSDAPAADAPAEPRVAERQAAPEPASEPQPPPEPRATAVLPSPAVSATATATPGRRVPLPPAVASLEELKSTEIRCYDQDPLACRRASAAYESGVLVARDAVRAETYRKVELTQLVRQCEKRAPLACLMLADRYETGDGVAVDARRAQKLTVHAAELCRNRPSEGCATDSPQP